MKVWMLYSPSKKRFISNLQDSSFSYKINNKTGWWKAEAEAKEALNTARASLAADIVRERYQAARYAKRAKDLEDGVPQEQVMPIMFDKRGCKLVKWIEDGNRARLYCTCCYLHLVCCLDRLGRRSHRFLSSL